jgi:signal transduction histidine kinase
METIRLLVVDDEVLMRAGVARALRGFTVSLPYVEEDYGLEVREAGTGEDALRLIGEQVPDIMLLDYKLPGISGLDVLDEVTKRQLDTLTVMITAYASLETAVSATRYGAYDFLAKPFTPEELRTSVHKAAKHLILSRQARRLTEERRRVRFEFISVLAHELKAPIAAVEGYLRMLQEQTAGSDIAAYGGMVDRSLARLEGMRKLILDILDLTRIESGQRARQIEPVDLVEVCRRALETAQPAAEKSGIRLELTGPASLVVDADRSELEIVLNNLVSNAVKYNRRDGRVDVTVAGDDATARVAVADTGIGLAPEEAARLFKEFVRIKSPKTRGIEGSGLGLSTVRKIVTAFYGGDVAVQSQPDKGSVFTVSLRRKAS